jgi:protein Tex
MKEVILRIEVDDVSRPQVLALLDEHLRNMYEITPAEQVFAFDANKLRGPDVTFWTAWDDEVLLGCAALKELSPAEFTDEKFGLPTVKDILKELEKPGRDPRPEFKTATFKEGVETLEDLKPGLVLEGVVTNVTHFGAFVDIGVHQDGLVHISALADQFVKDPHKVVSVGALVKVKVVEVDLKRKRIALTMRLDDEVLTGQKAAKSPTKTKPRRKVSEATDKPLSALAQALAKARENSK